MNTVRTLQVEQLAVEIYPDAAAMGQAAAAYAAEVLRASLAARAQANLICATGLSQVWFYEALAHVPSVDWQRVNVFHMDEYVGLSPAHPASFRRYLREKLVDRVHPGRFEGIQGEASDAAAECRRYAALLSAFPADLCCLGSGENGHLAFNDPPEARFDDPQPVRVVRLAEASRRQQVGEGFFASLAEVPERAITLTIPTLLAARQALVIVPEARKAAAVQAALEGPLTLSCPASVLRQFGHVRLLLDADAAGRLQS
jgi:glucosamine-6-phosphate deaminase